MIWRCALVKLAVAMLLMGACLPVFAAPRRVSFKTPDGWTIVGLYQAPQKKGMVAVLVHGVGAGKGEWDALNQELWKRGLGTLAIDLRGHGESAKGPEGRKGFADFDSRGEWRKAISDLNAAALFLNKAGVKDSRIGFVGGSIGANLSSQAAAERHSPWAVLLSPGFDYRGVAPADLSSIKTCVAASAADPYAFETALSLSKRQGAVFFQARSGHGAQMLADSVFLSKLADWIRAASADSP
jgi:pimeloyl-ACP methyl ester carboxylesterase